MNLSQLRAFVTAVEHGSFSAAGRALSVSQPAVTKQIQSLESDLDATLFDRHYRRVELTEQGQALLPHARKILDSLEKARAAVDRVSDQVTGRLTVAASTTPGQYALPRILGAFSDTFPDVGIQLMVADTADVVAAVESRDADLGMTGARIRGAGVEFEELGSDRLVMIAPPGLAVSPNARLEDVLEQPFIIREEGSGTRMVTEEALDAANVDPADLNVAIELGTSEAIVTAVEGGLGIGVVSSWAADKALELGTVKLVDLPRFPVDRPFWLVTPKARLSRAAEAFAEFMRTEARL
jgi:DNA-binding transcriptional LysR family regulator